MARLTLRRLNAMDNALSAMRGRGQHRRLGRNRDPRRSGSRKRMGFGEGEK